MSFEAGKLGLTGLKPEVPVKIMKYKNGLKNNFKVSQDRTCHFTELVINSSICQALVDSASASTIISKDVVKRLHIDDELITQDSVNLTAANGS